MSKLNQKERVKPSIPRSRRPSSDGRLRPQAANRFVADDNGDDNDQASKTEAEAANGKPSEGKNDGTEAPETSAAEAAATAAGPDSPSGWPSAMPLSAATPGSTHDASDDRERRSSAESALSAMAGESETAEWQAEASLAQSPGGASAQEGQSAESSTVGLQQLGSGAPDYEATESMVSVESHGSALSSSTEGQSEVSYGRNSLNLGDIRHRASSEQGLELKLASGLIYHEEDDIVEGDETKESGEGEEGGSDP